MCEKDVEQKTISDVLDEMRKLREEMKQDNQLNFQAIKDEIDINTKKISDNINSLDTKICNRIEPLELDVENLKKALKEKDTIIEKQEKALRKNNLVIYNIKETENEKLKVLVAHFLKTKLEVILEENQVADTYRLGKKNEQGEGNRPILVKLVNYWKKTEIFNSKSKLKGTIWVIKHDLSTKERKERRQLIEAAKELNEKGVEAKIEKNHLIIEGKKIEKEELSAALEKTIPETPKRFRTPDPKQTNSTKRQRGPQKSSATKVVQDKDLAEKISESVRKNIPQK